jgi:hypothetical protein
MVPDLRAAVHHHPPAHVTAHVTDHGGKVSKTQPFPPYNHSRPAISHSLIFPVGREWSQTFAPRFTTTRPHTSPTTSPHTAGRSRKLNHSRPTIIPALQSFPPCNHIPYLPCRARMVPDLRAAVHHHPPAHVTDHVTAHGGKVSKTQPFPPYNHSRLTISHSLSSL